MNTIHVYLDGDHDAGDGDDRLEANANLGGDGHLDVDGDAHLSIIKFYSFEVSSTRAAFDEQGI